MDDNKEKVLNDYKDKIKSAMEDLKTPGRRHRQIPNILTVLRMTAPLFIIPSVIIGNVPLLIGLIAGFSLTDLADGFIARTFNLTSELGKDLDAACDKIFAGTLLLAASFFNPLLLCNFVLEGAIAGVNAYKKLKGEDTKSSFVGKIKTWGLFSLIGAGFISPFVKVPGLFSSLLGITTGLQLLTISSYLKKEKKNIGNQQEIETDVKNETSTSKDEDIESLNKEKVLEPKESNSKGTNEDKPNITIDELREMKAFLKPEEHQEVQSNNPKVKRI